MGTTHPPEEPFMNSNCLSLSRLDIIRRGFKCFIQINPNTYANKPQDRQRHRKWPIGRLGSLKGKGREGKTRLWDEPSPPKSAIMMRWHSLKHIN